MKYCIFCDTDTDIEIVVRLRDEEVVPNQADSYYYGRALAKLVRQGYDPQVLDNVHVRSSSPWSETLFE